MRILCIGDVVGKCGAEMVQAQLPYLIKEEDLDFVIANGENATTGNGINRERADMLLDAGVDVITMGNHTFAKREICTLMKEGYPIVRPLNLPKGTPGKGALVCTRNGVKIGVINLLGRVYLNPCDSPFEAAISCVERMEADIIFVDFHAEATSEKAAMAWYLDGKVSAVFGTHTHVQTADERILPKGTGFLTDLGMTGPYHSILGVDKDIAVRKFVTLMHERYQIAEGNGILSGAIFEVDQDGICKIVQRVNIR